MTAHTTNTHHLDLRVQELPQLFNSMDPTPFHSKALDREAEAFIETWARGFSPKSALHLTIHLRTLPPEGSPNALLTEAIHHHFADKAKLTRQELRDLFWQGRISLLIGLAFLALCLLGAETIAQAGTSNAHAIARESLTIAGWVAMWRPMQLFLYDWWPLARRIATYRALSRAHVRVLHAG
ncbi:hypothetical protein RQP54_10920 [Curvibacter sp. APW13]|uniref:hypothetical protein n=1 Tax=Curvibacter sp. APW13 TaxID=3077236 RepID=UPI0028DFC642|nr:hypothetical protein [Curvibacter sp. APW13]MDT8991372.1 hypothetical protein [Curvibacter sp. APW13]